MFDAAGLSIGVAVVVTGVIVLKLCVIGSGTRTHAAIFVAAGVAVRVVGQDGAVVVKVDLGADHSHDLVGDVDGRQRLPSDEAGVDDVNVVVVTEMNDLFDVPVPDFHFVFFGNYFFEAFENFDGDSGNYFQLFVGRKNFEVVIFDDFDDIGIRIADLFRRLASASS